MEISKEFEKKMNDVADGMIHVQEKVAELEKKHTGVDFANIQEQADKAAQGLEELQALELKKTAEENQVRMLAIEKAITKGTNKENGTNPEHKESFYSYLRKGNVPSPESIEAYCDGMARKTLLSADPDKLKSYTKALVEGSNPDGGFWVTPERSSNIATRVFETSPVRGIASTITTSSSSVEMIIDDDEASCGWVGEVETRAETDTPQIGLLTIPVHEIYAEPKASQRMLDDAGFDIEGWLQGKVTDKFSRTENTSFVLGTGAKQPRGFMTYDAWTTAGTYQRDAIEQIAGTAGTVGVLDAPNDLIDLQNALLEPYQMGAVFAGTRTTFSDIMKMRETTTAASLGAFILDPTVLKTGSSRIVLGKSYVVMADIAEMAANSLSVAYGNFAEAYTIVDRFGVRVLRDPYTAKPYVKFYSTKRVGAAVTNFDALKILKTAAA